jgi:hypothetical protein
LCISRRCFHASFYDTWAKRKKKEKEKEKQQQKEKAFNPNSENNPVIDDQSQN